MFRPALLQRRPELSTPTLPSLMPLLSRTLRLWPASPGASALLSSVVLVLANTISVGDSLGFGSGRLFNHSVELALQVDLGVLCWLLRVVYLRSHQSEISRDSALPITCLVGAYASTTRKVLALVFLRFWIWWDLATHPSKAIPS